MEYSTDRLIFGMAGCTKDRGNCDRWFAKIKKIWENKDMNKRQTDVLFYVSLAMLALIAFLFIGSGEPVLFDDSGAYRRVERFEGVMPVYQLFLLVNQFIFGDAKYLEVVIVEQALLAAVCIILFVREIKNRFQLHYWEGYLLFFLSVLTFTTEMPAAMITQTIITEGLAYSLFYLLMILFLRAVWRKSYGFLAGSFVMVFFLAMLRSQLQILFGVCGILFLYLTWNRCGTLLKRVAGFLLGAAGCAVISVAGIWLTAVTADHYYTLINDNMKVNMFIMKVQNPEAYQEFLMNGDGGQRDDEEIKEAILTQRELAAAVERPIQTSQYTSLIFSRGMYEADEADAQLFEDKMTCGLYRVLYDAVDREQERYAYAQKGLWMWRDIVGGIGSVGKTALSAGSSYYQENWPDVYAANDFNEVWNRSLQTIGIRLIRAHFDRFLYHTLMMLPQAFICTVFFQIKPIYLLCHLVTLFLYLSALALMVWGYADKKASNECAEFMALIIGSNVVMVLVISAVFFGQQRYLVYNFGIFYIAYYLLVRELWNCHIRDKVVNRILRKGGIQK